MHVVVMGCGRVGSTLSLRLDELGHSVAVIDQNPIAFRRLGAEFSGSTIAASASTRQRSSKPASSPRTHSPR